MGKKLPEVTLTSPAPIERAPEVNLFEITGAKAAVIQEIAISEIRSSIREKARRDLRFDNLEKRLNIKILHVFIQMYIR